MSPAFVPLGKIDSGPRSQPAAARVASVDALRGLVVTLMIFVNDAAEIGRAPTWLKHVSASFDGMTLPDLVFPAFLFLAGMSIPLAFSRALDTGQNRGGLVVKILGRTFALLVMGVLMVNMEEYNPWFRGLWGVLAYGAMLFAFAVPPPSDHPRHRIFLVARGVGFTALFLLAVVYRTPEGNHLILGPLFSPPQTAWLNHSWWGILGLIGWAYLVAALVYLFVGRRREWLVGATALLMLLYAADASPYSARLAARPWLDGADSLINAVRNFLGGLNAHVSLGSSVGALASITTAGCCLGSLLTRRSELQSDQERLRWGTGFALGLFAAALLFDPLFGINKIHATPTWCLLSAGLTAFAWVFLYWLMDVRQHRSWARIVAPAGANPLLAYLLHPLIFMLANLAGLPLGFYHNEQWPVLVSLAESLVTAFLVVQLTGLIVRTGYRLKV